MTPPVPARRTPRWLVPAALALLVGALHLFDNALWRLVRFSDRAALEQRDWYQFFRAVGYWPLWIALGLAVFFSRRDRARPGLLLMIAPGLAGLAAELLKLVFARQRPGTTGEHVWRGWLAGFSDGSNLGLPSSHAAVAFGGAFAAAILWPRAGGVALAAATLCGLSRMMSGAHFASDVAAAALVGYLGAHAARLLLAPRAAEVHACA